MKQIYYPFICLFLALTSCQNDDSTEIIESQPVTFTVGTYSRITQEGTFVKGNSIGVFAYDSSKKIFTGRNAKYIYDGTVFNAASLSETIYVGKGADVDFYVYSPYDPSCTDPKNITHAVGNQSTLEGWLNADFMTATYTEPIKDAVINLNFSHRFSTLQVKADKSEEVSSALIEKVKSAATFNLLTGNCQTSDAISNVDMYLYKTEGGMKYYRVTIPAQSISNTSNFIIQKNIDGTSAKLKGTENLVLEPGKIHNLYVSSKRRITINSYLPGGATKGSGDYTLGSSCNLSTSVNTGYEFLGWYENNKLVYTNDRYTFNVTKDRTLDVKYRSYGPWEITLETEGNPIPASGGSAVIRASVSRDVLVNGQPVGKDNSSDKVILSMEQKEGFTFSGNTVTADENKRESNREVKVTATIGQGETLVSKTITITQSFGKQSYGAWQIDFFANPSTIAASGGSSTITATARREILINDKPTGKYENRTPKLTISGNSAFTLSGSTVSVGNNASDSSRSTTVTASIEGVSKSVTITQSAGKKTFGEWGAWTTNSITASANPSSFGSNGGTSTLKVIAEQTHKRQILWNGIATDSETQTMNNDVTSSVSWSGSANGFSRNGSSVVVDKNPNSSERSVTYTASYGDKRASVRITQSAHQIVTTYGEWEVSISANPTSFGESGGSGTITATAKRSVMYDGVHDHYETKVPSVSSNAAWCKVSGSSFSVDKNTSSSRTARLTASYGGKSDYVTITQSAHVASIHYEFRASPTKPRTFGYNGGSQTITITSKKFSDGTVVVPNVGYTSSGGGGWASFSNGTLTVSANNSSKVRRTTITLTQDGSGRTIEFVVMQNGKVNIDVGN